MRALEKRAPLFEDFDLREIIHEASIVTGAHVRGACLRAICLAPPALAVNCDVNACISQRNKGGAGLSTSGTNCTSWCLQTMQERKAAKQCK